MTWSRPWSLVLAALAALAAMAGRLPAPAAVVAIAVTFGFTPGWIAVRHLAPGARPAFLTLLALVVSPLLVGGPAAAALALGAAPAIAREEDEFRALATDPAFRRMTDSAGAGGAAARATGLPR